MANGPQREKSAGEEQTGARQQDLDPIGAGTSDRETVEAFRKPGHGDASDAAANPKAKDPGERRRVDPRASPPFAEG